MFLSKFSAATRKTREAAGARLQCVEEAENENLDVNGRMNRCKKGWRMGGRGHRQTGLKNTICPLRSFSQDTQKNIPIKCRINTVCTNMNGLSCESL